MIAVFDNFPALRAIDSPESTAITVRRDFSFDMKHKLTRYRLSDEATSNEYTAVSVEAAVAQFLRRYDTAEMLDGETFTARVYSGEDLLDLVAVATVTADGKSGVKSYAIEAR